MNETDLAEINAVLTKLRGNAPNPAAVLAELRSAGCTVEAGLAGTLLVGGAIPGGMPPKIKACKTAILRLLAEAPVKVLGFWEPDEARCLADTLSRRFHAIGGWAVTPELGPEAALAMDAIDAAWDNRNMTAFRRAVERFVDFLDRIYPRLDGPGVHFEKEPRLQTFSGWVRKTGGKTWTKVASDYTDKTALHAAVSAYTKGMQFADVAVIESDRDPNKEKWK